MCNCICRYLWSSNIPFHTTFCFSEILTIFQSIIYASRKFLRWCLVIHICRYALHRHLGCINQCFTWLWENKSVQITTLFHSVQCCLNCLNVAREDLAWPWLSWWQLQWKSDDKWCWLPAQARAGNICCNIWQYLPDSLQTNIEKSKTLFLRWTDTICSNLVENGFWWFSTFHHHEPAHQIS